MNNLIAIENDLYDIAARLRALNEGYKVFYNVKNERYEIHNMNQKGNTLSLTLEYPELDARAIDAVNFTRVENARRLFAEAEKNNERLEKESLKKGVEKAEELLKGGCARENKRRA